MFANALYSTGMGAARFVAIKMYVQDKKRQIKNYQLVGIIISLSSICYVLYSVRLFSVVPQGHIPCIQLLLSHFTHLLSLASIFVRHFVSEKARN